MQKFTISTCKKLPLAKPSSKPAPFPGNYPTRIHIVWLDTFVRKKMAPIVNKDGVPTFSRPYHIIKHPDYFGKPYAGLGWKVQGLFGTNRIFSIMEFDKEHIIFSYCQSKGLQWFATLFSSYHPTCAPVVHDFSNWFARPFGVQRFNKHPYYMNTQVSFIDTHVAEQHLMVLLGKKVEPAFQAKADLNYSSLNWMQKK